MMVAKQVAAEEETDPRLRWLKPLVIGLSALFVILLLVLMVGMITGVPGRKAQSALPASMPPASMPTASVNTMEQSLGLPAGARVMESFGAGDRVILRVQLPDGGERLLSLDARSLTPLSGLTIQSGQ